MLTIGEYSVSVLVSHQFALDGGAMFGAVPKTLWQKKIAADDRNRIPLVTRILVLRSAERLVVVDVGCGGKWNEKERDIFAIRPLLSRPLHEVLNGVTDVVLTHFHFDHSGGVSYLDDAGNVRLSFPDATHYVQSEHWQYAVQPLIREKASFIEANIAPLRDARLSLTEDGQEILPGVSVHKFHGHTRGYQAVRVTDGTSTVAFPSDLVPTAHHVPVVWLMGYDICAERTVSEKQSFLQHAADENWLLVFAHDKDTEAGRVGLQDSGKFELIRSEQVPAYAP